LTELVLKYSPLEVSVPWASAAVRECLGKGEEGAMAARRKESPSEATWGEAGRGKIVVTASEPSGSEVGNQQAGGVDKGALGQVGAQRVAKPVEMKLCKPSTIAPSGDCEEDMRRWVEEGGLESGLDEEGLKTEVPGLEEEGGRPGKARLGNDRLTSETAREEDDGLRTEVLELEDDDGAEPEELPVVTSMTIEGRRQVLGLLIEFLVGTLSRAESALSEEVMQEDGMEGQVAVGEGGHVELDLDQLTQVVTTLTTLCKGADLEWKGSARNVFETQMEERGGSAGLDEDSVDPQGGLDEGFADQQEVLRLLGKATIDKRGSIEHVGGELLDERGGFRLLKEGLLDEQGGLRGLNKEVLGEQGGPKDLGEELLDERGCLRVLECVCLALRPVDETVVWLTELCENALLGAEKEIEIADDAGNSAGFETGHLETRRSNLENLQSLSQGMGLSREEPSNVESFAGGPSSKAGGHLPGLDGVTGSKSEEKGSDGPHRLDGGSGPCGDLKEKGADWRVASERAGDEESLEGVPDAAQVQVAVDLARLGVALQRAAEGMIERSSSRWPKVSVSVRNKSSLCFALLREGSALWSEMHRGR
jgi:hypothetical protein